ncbi:MAG: hypothetical protein J2P28_10945 [Actinobacteria bacterium]|nr:hypothetical protein [Actinomycetota bacterium]
MARSGRRRGGSRQRGRAGRANPRNRAPGTRNLSTREYGMATTASSRTARYAYPRGVGKDRGKRPSYPINNLRRARNALARAAQSNTAGTVTHVKRALRAKGGAYAALANRSTAGSTGGRRRGR